MNVYIQNNYQVYSPNHDKPSSLNSPAGFHPSEVPSSAASTYLVQLGFSKQLPSVYISRMQIYIIETYTGTSTYQQTTSRYTWQGINLELFSDDIPPQSALFNPYTIGIHFDSQLVYSQSRVPDISTHLRSFKTYKHPLNKWNSTPTNIYLIQFGYVVSFWEGLCQFQGVQI